MTISLTNWFSWSRIATIGTNPYAKLSIAAPIIAPLALYTTKVSTYFNDHFSTDISPTGMPWLYLSLLSLSAAQFCFNSWAPTEFKEYRSRADYAARGGADLLTADWESRAIDLINLELERDSTLLSAIDAIDVAILQKLDDVPKERVGTILNQLKQSRKLEPHQGQMFRETLSHLHHDLDQNGFTKVDRINILKMLNLARGTGGTRTYVDVEGDRKALRAQLYDTLNLSRPLRRVIVTALYAFGLSFFLWNIPRNIVTNILSLI